MSLTLTITPARALAAFCAVGWGLTAAVGRRAARLARCFSQVEIDEAIRENTFRLENAGEQDDGIMPVTIFVVEAEQPPIPDRRWFWHVAAACPGHPDDVPGMQTVHSGSGWSETAADANVAAHDCLRELAPNVEAGVVSCSQAADDGEDG